MVCLTICLRRWETNERIQPLFSFLNKMAEPPPIYGIEKIGMPIPHFDKLFIEQGIFGF